MKYQYSFEIRKNLGYSDIEFKRSLVWQCGYPIDSFIQDFLDIRTTFDLYKHKIIGKETYDVIYESDCSLTVRVWV